MYVTGRYCARYLDHGTKKSAGTYDTLEEAERAGDLAERGEAELTLALYFYRQWLVEDRVEVKTRSDYESCFRLHIAPVLGDKPVADVTASC